jgi:monoamine oxidase
LDLPVSGDDLEKLREMLATFGDLTKTESGYAYRNKSGHAGYDVPPGLANEPGKVLSPMALDELLRSRVWDDYIYRDTDYSWQTSLMEPVGGMDNFFKGFLPPAARPPGRHDRGARPLRREGDGDRGRDGQGDRLLRRPRH